MGGEAQVEPRLDKFFTKLRCWGEPCFNMENEPDFVTPYAYVFAGQAVEDAGSDPAHRQGNLQDHAARACPATTTWARLRACTCGTRWDSTPPCRAWAAWCWARPCSTRPRCGWPADRTLVITREGDGVYVQTCDARWRSYPQVPGCLSASCTPAPRSFISR